MVSGDFTAPDRFEGRYADAEVPRRENYGAAPKDKPALQRPFEGLPELGPEGVTPDQTIRDRMEMLLGVDASVGRWSTCSSSEVSSLTPSSCSRATTAISVRTEPYKYIRSTDLENMDELYDLKTDPYELTNLIDASESQGTLAEMQNELDALPRRNGAITAITE